NDPCHRHLKSRLPVVTGSWIKCALRAATALGASMWRCQLSDRLWPRLTYVVGVHIKCSEERSAHQPSMVNSGRRTSDATALQCGPEPTTVTLTALGLARMAVPW